MSAANTLASLVQDFPAQIIANAKGPLSTAVAVATISLASATTAPPVTGEAPVVFLIAAAAEAEVGLHHLCCLACNACRQQGSLCQWAGLALLPHQSLLSPCTALGAQA